jgi:hypothetical protein
MRHLSALEDQPGVWLIHRTTRRVSLTPIEDVCVEFCASMLRDLELSQEDCPCTPYDAWARSASLRRDPSELCIWRMLWGSFWPTTRTSASHSF